MKITELYQDYLPVDDVFTEEPEKVRKVKYIIFNKLTEPNRRIIILYAELQSIRKVAQKLGISAASAWLKITEIKNEIKSYL